MKKQLLVLLVSLAAATSALAQGTVNFSNAGGASANAPVRDQNNVLLSGTDYRADLFYGPANTADASSLTSLGLSVGFGSNGYFFGGSQAIPSVPGGTQVTFQIRVWRLADGATYAAAASNPSAFVGEGNLIQYTLATSPTPAGPMNGITGFSLHAVPEPSSIALGVLGAGSLLFLRRKK